MRYFKTLAWLIVFIAITIAFNFKFSMILTPTGKMGDITSFNIIASVSYMFSWFILAVIAGYKKYREILTASIIYSMLPILGYITGVLFAGTKLMVLILFTFCWAVPTQGICFGNEMLFKAMMIVQPVIFWIGYHISGIIKRQRFFKEG